MFKKHGHFPITTGEGSNRVEQANQYLPTITLLQCYSLIYSFAVKLFVCIIIDEISKIAPSEFKFVRSICNVYHFKIIDKWKTRRLPESFLFAHLNTVISRIITSL